MGATYRPRRRKKYLKIANVSIKVYLISKLGTTNDTTCKNNTSGDLVKDVGLRWRMLGFGLNGPIY